MLTALTGILKAVSSKRIVKVKSRNLLKAIDYSAY